MLLVSSCHFLLNNALSPIHDAIMGMDAIPPAIPSRQNDPAPYFPLPFITYVHNYPFHAPEAFLPPILCHSPSLLPDLLRHPTLIHNLKM